MDRMDQDTRWHPNRMPKRGIERNNTLNILTVNAWEGTSDPQPYELYKRPHHIFHMNTNTEACEAPEHCKAIMKNLHYRKTNLHGQKDCRYNFVIGGDLNVYEVRGFNIQPLLPIAYQNQFGKAAFLIGYMGNFTDKEVPLAMWDIACYLVDVGVKNGFLKYSHKHHRLFDKPDQRQYEGYQDRDNFPRQQRYGGFQDRDNVPRQQRYGGFQDRDNFPRQQRYGGSQPRENFSRQQNNWGSSQEDDFN